MVDKRYNLATRLALSPEEVQFRGLLDRLVAIFGSKYEIWIRNEDFKRTISVGILKRYLDGSGVAAIICLKYYGQSTYGSIDPLIIRATFSHLTSSSNQDLLINLPKQTFMFC